MKTWSDKIALLCTGRGGWAKKRSDDSERDESNEEQLQYRKQYICSLPGTMSPAMAMGHGNAYKPNASAMVFDPCLESTHETTETNNAITKSITPSPTVAINMFG